LEDKSVRIRRVPRIFAMMFLTSIQRELAFRTSLLFQLATTTITTLAALVTIGMVYTQTATLGGWNRGESIVLLGTWMIASGILTTFIEPNVLWFSEQVKSGKLDDILLRPVSSLFLATLGNHAPVRLMQVLAGGLVVILGCRESGTAPGTMHLAAWLAMMTIAIIVTWATRSMVMVIALWSPSLGLDAVYDGIWQFGRYPVAMYRQPFRLVLTSVLPLAFITTLPARALTRGIDAKLLLLAIAVAIIAVQIVRTFWHLGLRRYTSATS
jgi:ABC-2 type transport system permease protein